MSFKDKANEVLEHGKAERGNYSPQQDSVPLRMYNYWAQNRPKHVPPRENFCHYWRVVAIWAPLWFLLNKTTDFAETRTGKVVIVSSLLLILAVGLSLGGSFAWGVAGWIALGLYSALGVIVGGVQENEMAIDNGDPLEGRFFWLFTLPAVVGFAVCRAVRKFTASDARKKAVELALKVVVATIGIAAAGFLVFQLALLIIANPLNALIGLGIVVGVAVLLTGVTIGLSALSSALKMKHEKAREARTVWVDEDYFGDTIKVPVVQPSRVAKFFMAIGDFLNLAFQVVRVKKWKICPIVEIPKA